MLWFCHFFWDWSMLCTCAVSFFSLCLAWYARLIPRFYCSKKCIDFPPNNLWTVVSQLSLKGEKNLSPIPLMIVISWINEDTLLRRAWRWGRDRCKNRTLACPNHWTRSWREQNMVVTSYLSARCLPWLWNKSIKRFTLKKIMSKISIITIE